MMSPNRRRYPRGKESFQVRVVGASGRSWTGEALDLSPFGMKVRDGQAEPRSIARLEFSLPGGGPTVMITSLVERNDPDGVAFAFVDLSRAEFRLVRQAVDGLLLRKKLWVMIVESDRPLAEALGDYVEAEGHTPIIVSTAEDALAYAGHDAPDAILLDLRLPGISGVEFLEEMIRRHMRIPIVVISSPADDDVLRSLRLGALDFIERPPTIDRLRITIDALELRSLEQRLSEMERSASLY